MLAATRRIQLVITAAIVASLFAACATTNPLAVAQTPAQKYAAIKLTYDALLTPAATVVADTTVPANTRRALQAAVAASGDIYNSLNTAYIDYLAAKGALGAGETTSDKLNIASANLDHWIAQLQTVVERLATLIKH